MHDIATQEHKYTGTVLHRNSATQEHSYTGTYLHRTQSTLQANRVIGMQNVSAQNIATQEHIYIGHS